ncbi:hypothetical protein D3C75_748450 [compost metagenome]
MTRAVHRLDGVLAVLGLGGEHGLGIFFPVAGTLPQHAIHHEGAFHLLIIVLLELAADESFQLAEDGPAIVVPEHHAGGLFLHVVQVELLADLAVVALGGLFKTLQVGLELLLVGPGGAVDALQHLVVGVAAPVGAGHLLQLEMVAVTHVRHVGAATHVDVLFVMIETGLVITGDVLIQDLDLVGLAAGLEHVARLLPGDLLLDDVVILGGQRQHALFQGSQIFIGQGAVEINVVVKTVVDHRTYGHLGLGPELLDGMTQQVGTGVAQNVQTVFVFGGDDGQGGIGFDQLARIHQFTVHPAGNARLGETGTYVGGDVHDGNGVGKLTLAAVRQSNDWH